MGLDAVEDCLLTGGQGISEGTTKYGNFFWGPRITRITRILWSGFQLLREIMLKKQNTRKPIFLFFASIFSFRISRILYKSRGQFCFEFKLTV